MKESKKGDQLMLLNSKLDFCKGVKKCFNNIKQ